MLGSGSSANSYIFEYGDFSFILDNGFSSRELLRRMKELSFDPRKLEFIFLSHIHSDHLKGVESLSRDLKLPVVIHENLAIDQYTKKYLHKKLSVSPGREYCFKNLKFTAFDTYHDAPSSLSYYFELAGVKITVITDTGCFDQIMIDFASQSHILFLESNYSDELLANGKYPPFLKQRISSDKGHLSNIQAAEFLEQVTGSDKCELEQIYLCHLSKNNNSVETVKDEIGNLCNGEIPLRICDRGEMVPGAEIQASKSTLVPGGNSSCRSSYSEISAV